MENPPPLKTGGSWRRPLQYHSVKRLGATSTLPSFHTTLCSFRKLFLLRTNSISIPFSVDVLHVFPNRVPQRLCPLGVVEDANLVRVEILGHPLGVAPLRQRPLNDDPVIAGQSDGDPALVPFRQEFDAHSGIIIDIQFGSGYAGLGIHVNTLHRLIRELELKPSVV